MDALTKSNPGISYNNTDFSSSYMSYRGLITEQKRSLKGQFYATASDESVAADSGVFEAANLHKLIDRTDSGNSTGSYWYVVFILLFLFVVFILFVLCCLVLLY